MQNLMISWNIWLCNTTNMSVVPGIKPFFTEQLCLVSPYLMLWCRLFWVITTEHLIFPKRYTFLFVYFRSVRKITENFELFSFISVNYNTTLFFIELDIHLMQNYIFLSYYFYVIHSYGFIFVCSYYRSMLQENGFNKIVALT